MKFTTKIQKLANLAITRKYDFFNQDGSPSITRIRKNAPKYVRKGDKWEYNLAEEIERQLKIRADRAAAQPTATPFTKETAIRKLTAKLGKKLSNDWSYREGSMGNEFAVKLADAVEMKVWYDEDWDGYSKSCRYAAKIWQFQLNMPFDHSFEWIGGLLTVFPGRKIDRNVVTPVIWFEQSRGMELKKVEGYIYKGFHTKASSKKVAKKKITKQRNEMIAFKLRQRTNANVRRNKAAVEQIKIEIQNSQVWVSYDDSRSAGNCPAGMKNYISRNGLNAQHGYRADYLMEIATDSEAFAVRRAINHAKSRKALRLIAQV